MAKPHPNDASYLPTLSVSITLQAVYPAVIGIGPNAPVHRVRFICKVVTHWRNVYLSPLDLCLSVTLKDDRVTTLYTLWTIPSFNVARNSSAPALICLCMPMVPNSEVEIVCRMCKVMDVLPSQGCIRSSDGS